jgi:hypothetical protein
MPHANHIQDLPAQLQQFTGTEGYYRYHSNTLLTDGALYLAEQAACFWLLDVYASHLVNISHQEQFTCLKFSRTLDQGKVLISDGNGGVLAEQHIPYTDFPLD